MIEVRIGRLEDASAEAVLCPVSSDLSPVSPTMSRFQQAAGTQVADHCRRLGDLPVGSAVITAAGDLPSRFVIHAVVRSASENASVSTVRLALTNGLRRLDEWGIESVAMTPLGMGAGNLDAEESAEVMLPLLVEHCRSSSRLASVVVVTEDEYQRAAFTASALRHGAGAAGPALESPPPHR